MIPLLPEEPVLRRLARLRVQWRVAPSSWVAGSRRVNRPGSSREFQGFRPYESGDDLRDLDWAASSRFDRPYVRVYHQEVAPSLLLMIDASASMSFGDPSKLAYAQALACALGYLALAHHDRVGAVGFTDHVTARLPAGRGSGQWAALRRLVANLTSSGSTRLGDIPSALPGLQSLHGLVVVLSDFCPAEAFVSGLRRLAACPVSVAAVQVLSPQELEPPLEGELQLVDLETGETRSGWIGAVERAAYRARLASVETEVARVCAESGVRHARVSTAVPIARCLQETLVRAGLLRRGGD